MNTPEHNKHNKIERLRDVLQKTDALFQAVEAWILRRIARDRQWVLLILILSAFLRLPFLDYPDRTLFDEVIYTNFAIHIIHEAPFFDIHPPLGRLIFAQIAAHSPFNLWGLPMETNMQFGEFPYATLRLFVALFGTLLPLLFYMIGRLLGYTPRQAGIVALFAIFDNALVLYSRTVLPDTLLLFANFLGFAAAIAATKTKTRGRRNMLIVLAGLLLGLAMATKWTALGVIGTIWILFFSARMYRAIIATGIIVIVCYLGIFIAYFTHFPQGGRVDPVLYPYNKPWIADMRFPRGERIGDIAEYLPQMHQVMLRADSDPDISKVTLQSAGPLSWPAARSSLTFWVNDAQNKTIVLRGNELLWFLTFFALLFEIGWIMARLTRKHSWPIDRVETILLVGYFSNYLPFFLIHRPMFLYHYFTAFIFLLLLLPRIAPRMISCIGSITHDAALAKTLMYATILLVMINFFLIAPTTYGL